MFTEHTTIIRSHKKQTTSETCQNMPIDSLSRWILRDSYPPPQEPYDMRNEYLNLLFCLLLTCFGLLHNLQQGETELGSAIVGLGNQEKSRGILEHQGLNTATDIGIIFGIEFKVNKTGSFFVNTS